MFKMTVCEMYMYILILSKCLSHVLSLILWRLTSVCYIKIQFISQIEHCACIQWMLCRETVAVWTKCRVFLC